jgi:hypothetical protein
VSTNGGDGFYAVAAASGAAVRATLRNDVFSGNGKFGLQFLGTFGFALGTIIDNSITRISPAPSTAPCLTAAAVL